jgi:hypothetical protein
VYRVVGVGVCMCMLACALVCLGVPWSSY